MSTLCAGSGKVPSAEVVAGALVPLGDTPAEAIQVALRQLPPTTSCLIIVYQLWFHVNDKTCSSKFTFCFNTICCETC